ncbi:hypothetical protein PoB_004974200 [Plakobranchus ocellatus]|uniref:Uncharacterized protein n=1 Tax=Plakobranchus ocellatus TaxID=259542 RepID=A0AAV4BW17_9GAST|nr:hypothetical protein PoB_004974200 [Plakobranchus ocellatus]
MDSSTLQKIKENDVAFRYYMIRSSRAYNDVNLQANQSGRLHVNQSTAGTPTPSPARPPDRENNVRGRRGHSCRTSSTSDSVQVGCRLARPARCSLGGESHKLYQSDRTKQRIVAHAIRGYYWMVADSKAVDTPYIRILRGSSTGESQNSEIPYLDAICAVDCEGIVRLIVRELCG